jgi:hypothetical protein
MIGHRAMRHPSVAGLAAAALALGTLPPASTRAAAPAARADGIAGTVRSNSGPEAGVWVIAETDQLPTRYVKIVVTDEHGRFLIPDLPPASCRVWVRGYGLSDSARFSGTPGSRLDLAVTPASDARSAAQIFPAAYWYALMRLPVPEQVIQIPGGLNGYLMWMKNEGCVGCHQMGDLSTRTIPGDLSRFSSTQSAWSRRIQSGQAGGSMVQIAMGTLQGIPIKYLADWTDRIAAGAVPASTPARPAGIERNVVLTVSEWGSEKTYLHDLSGTDRNHPSVNAYGSLYGAPELSTDDFPVFEPRSNSARTFRATVRDADVPSTRNDPVTASSPYWGDERIWGSEAIAHNPMLDPKGRVWYTARVRSLVNPAYCRTGSSHPSARLFPIAQSGRQLSFYDPASGHYTYIDTCFSTHHLQFADDASRTLWTSGGDEVIGWFDTRHFDETGDAVTSQHWAPLVLDSAGTGRLVPWVEPGRPPTSGMDQRLAASYYAVMPNPADGSVWGTVAFQYPGAILRFDPQTMLTEMYRVPAPGFGVRGADIDTQGVVWVSLGSGHLGRFDRRLCKGPLNGPRATGDHCPEGWKFYSLPGPGFLDQPQMSVESSYYAWVDQHDTLGLGANVPIATGNLFDGIHVLVNGKFITLRVPYPLGFYAKGLEGRIDDADAGWKGRGLWLTSGDRTPWHHEGGKGEKPLIVHMQMRPDPLAN